MLYLMSLLLQCQVKECTVEFNSKLSSMKATSTESSSTYSETRSKSAGWFSSSSFTSSFSSQRSDKNSNQESRSFSMSVFVKAVQDDMPTGLRKILEILDQAVLIENN